MCYLRLRQEARRARIGDVLRGNTTGAVQWHSLRAKKTEINLIFLMWSIRICGLTRLYISNLAWRFSFYFGTDIFLLMRLRLRLELYMGG